MPDSVKLMVAGKRIENFLSYSVESDLFTADDAFRLALADPETELSEGAACELYVNDQRELTGVVERIEESCDKSGRRLEASGRDVLGMLNGTYCEEFLTLQNIELKALANRLLRNIKWVNRSAIEYGKGNKLRAAALSHKKEEFEFAQIEPGQTVFEVLSEYALSRGMLFFALPDGTLVFGEPLTGGKPEFSIVFRRDGSGNAMKAGRVRDISRQYSKVVITGQQQGTDGTEASGVNKMGELSNPDFPFYKPFVAAVRQDGQDPKKYARVLLDKQRFDGSQISYSVPGHSQNGRNWQINAICSVDDDVHRLKGDYLIHGRVFRLSKDEGSITELRLAPLGALPV